MLVATAPTVYGIETHKLNKNVLKKILELQQHLPFTVLKRFTDGSPITIISPALQQHLPFTVLKLSRPLISTDSARVATAPTVYGIETWKYKVYM